MRLTILVVAASLPLAACGSPTTSQANNAQANIGNENRAPEASASSVAAVPMSPVSGDQAKSLMHERHEGMETIGKANKAIRDQLQASSPDLGVVRANAAKLADLAQKSTDWFHAGTGPDVGKTGAKPEIWQNPQDFSAKLSAFQSEAKAFKNASDGSDVGAIKARLETLGQSCKACHDKYRSKMEH